MKVLVVGASGATGRLLVEQLLSHNIHVNAIVRSTDALPDKPHLTKIEASVHSLSASAMAAHVKGCDGVISCLGHNLNFKGLYGKPRLLVTETLQCICAAIQSLGGDKPVKVILMNTTGNSNRDIPEKIPLSQRIVVGLLRVLLPPHVDNEKAADFLRTDIGQQNKAIEWVAIRPDALTNEDEVSPYTLHPSPIRNPIFDSGATSRINVAHLMKALIVDDDIWQQWQGQMPVIYNDV